MSSSSSGASAGAYGIGVGIAGGATTAVTQQNQGVAALIVMLAVLFFIFAYCCWGAPFCRSLRRRHCCCTVEDSDSESGGFRSNSVSAHGNNDQAMLATPTIILLPHGRMLVVDGTIFTQFQAENTGLDLVELGESVMRAQRNPGGGTRHQLQNSQGSIMEMDAETPSKDSMGSLGCFPPPTYESIYGKEETGDMPPSYSDILLHRFANLPFEIEMQEFGHDSKEEIEMRSLENCPHIISNPINTLNYPYAVAGAATAPSSYSSQSLPRNHHRNPTLINNPLDSYYVDNELSGLYRNRRRRSATLSNNNNPAVSQFNRARRTSVELGNTNLRMRNDNEVNQRQYNRDRRNSRTNTEEQAIAENIQDNRFAHSWDQTSRSQNDAMNSRNNARSDSRRTEDPCERSRTNSVYSRSRSEDNESVRVRPGSRISIDRIDWSLSDLDVRYPSEDEIADSRSERHFTECDEASASEDDPSNFKALADIRESRV